MANNRLWLIHKPSGKRTLLAKYYPSSGWYPWIYDKEDIAEKGISQVLQANQSENMWGNGHEFKLEIEVNERSWNHIWFKICHFFWKLRLRYGAL